MRVYLLSTERLLIEIDGWGIIEQIGSRGLDVYATHKCLHEAPEGGGDSD